MRKLILSTSFRCPIAVVKHAQWRAPHMRWPEWAQPGSVTDFTSWSVATIPDGAAILCRNNAPLFRTALRLLKAGRYPQIIGNDVGKNLLKILKKFGKSDLPQAQVFDEVEKWKVEKLRKSRTKGSVQDQAECLLLFAEQGQTLGDAIAYAEHIFASQGPITLCTIHKAKGLEFPDVFILDQQLIRLDEDQEKNLLYVAQTRAKHSLSYVTTEGWQA